MFDKPFRYFVFLYLLELLHLLFNRCCALLWYRGTYKCEQSYLFTYEGWSKHMYFNITIKY